jgi:squalene-hopene/tetraprenyl-beta-curcumene cyclase
MNRNTRASLLALLLPVLAIPVAACTETVIVEEEETKPGGPGTTPPGETPPGTEANPLEGLAADWQVKAAGYLDKRAATWLSDPPNISNVPCAMSCHTTFTYVMARSALAPFAKTASADSARGQFEERVSEAVAGTAVSFYGKNGDTKVIQSHATESVLNAVALGLDDIGRGKPLSAASKSALDQMWTQQRTDGTWDWLEFGLEPWETRNDFGAAIAALVTGSIPEASTPKQAAGTTKLIGYVQKRITAMALHDRAFVLYASGKLKTLLKDGQADTIAAALTATQLEDGGFSLGAWGKGDIASEVAKTSDGYATAVATLALCTGATDGTKRPDVKKGLAWLAKNQASDGSWPGQSVNQDTAQVKGFMTDAATSFASLAITQCVTPAAQ